MTDKKNFDQHQDCMLKIVAPYIEKEYNYVV
jgi:hypothetical protein